MDRKNKLDILYNIMTPLNEISPRIIIAVSIFLFILVFLSVFLAVYFSDKRGWYVAIPSIIAAISGGLLITVLWYYNKPINNKPINNTQFIYANY